MTGGFRSARPSGSASLPRAPARAGFFLAGGALVLPSVLAAGALRDDTLALTGLALATAVALAAAYAATLSRPIAAALAAVALAVLATAAGTLTAPYRDAALRSLALSGAILAAFTAGVALPPRGAAAFLDGLAASSLAVVALSVAGSALGPGVTHWPFVNPGQLGALAAAGAACFFVPERGPGSSPRERRASRRPSGADVDRAGVGWRDLAAAAGVLLCAATGSRIALITLTGIVALRLFFVRSALARMPRVARGGRSWLLAACLVAAGAFGSLRPASDFGPAELAASGSLRERVLVWEATARLALAEPILGAGPGAYASAVWRFTPPALTGAVEHAHSTPLLTLAERGLLGSLPWVLAGVVWLRAVFASGRTRSAGTAGRRALAGFAALAIQGSLDVTLSTTSLAVTCALLAGVAAAAGSHVFASEASPVPPGAADLRRMLLAVAVASAVPCGGWMWLSWFRARSDAALAGGDPRAAAELARRSLERLPSDRLSLRRLGEWGTLAALDPADPYAHLGVAAWHRSEGRQAEAIRHARRAVAAFPGGIEPRVYLLGLLVERGELTAAVDAWEQLRSLSPGRAVDQAVGLAEHLQNTALAESLLAGDEGGLSRLGEWAARTGRVDVALRLLASRTDPAGRRLRAQALTAGGRIEEARVLLRTLVGEGGPDAEHAVLLMADLVRTEEEAAEVEPALRKAAAQPGTREAARRLVRLLDLAGGPPEADRWLDEALAREPARTDLVDLRLHRREAGGDIAGAMADAERLVALRPREPEGLLDLARLLERRGHPVEAARLRHEAASRRD